MPQRKQPASLEKIALNVLHEFVLDYCNKFSVNDNLDELRHGVCIIKKHVCSFIPWPLLGEFCNRFLDEFSSDNRPDSHERAALEILMDIEIVGIRCTGQMIRNLDPKDLGRLRILEKLDLQYLHRMEIDFGNFRLTELTEFIYPKYCSDHHLEVIGQNCSKLRVLNIRDSDVTDEGLRALSPCSELRVVDVFNCPVSNDGINNLLLVNKKIEELAHWDITFKYQNTGKASCLDSTVYPLMRRYSFQSDGDIRRDLQTMVAKFPNLTHLDITCSMNEDLTVLKSLNKLTGIDISFGLGTFSHNFLEDIMKSLRKLLTYIGSNITILKVTRDIGLVWSQDDVNFVFTYCPNLEYFKFERAGGVVVIPPFQKLKELITRVPPSYTGMVNLSNPKLEFGIMPSLGTLSLDRYGMTVKSIEAIMLDDIKFPKLSVIETRGLKVDEIMQLEKIARDKNLDFKMNCPIGISDSEFRDFMSLCFANGFDLLP